MTMKMFSHFLFANKFICSSSLKQVVTRFIPVLNKICTSMTYHYKHVWDFGIPSLFWWILVGECWPELREIQPLQKQWKLWHQCSMNSLHYNLQLLAYALVIKTHVCMWRVLLIAGTCVSINQWRSPCWLNLKLNCECSQPSGPLQTALH